MWTSSVSFSPNKKAFKPASRQDSLCTAKTGWNEVNKCIGTIKMFVISITYFSADFSLEMREIFREYI